MTLRPNTVDENVYREVITDNCYRLPPQFPPGAVVIDIGCHIGTFSKLCAECGAASILAFELEQENYAIARENLAPYPQVGVGAGCRSGSYNEAAYAGGTT